MFFEEAPAAVAYSFQPSKPTVLAHNLNENKTEFSLDDVAFFDSLVFPYDFSVVAHIDTWLSEYDELPANGDIIDVKCPKGLLIPTYIPPVLPRTTPVPVFGDTGATGPRGLEGERGPQGATGPQEDTGLQGAAGADGATGLTGLPGAEGATGATGPIGATGAQGVKGERGEKGEPGPPGAVVRVSGNDTLPAEVITNDGSPLADITQSPIFAVSVAGWLALLTILLIIIVAYIVSKNRKAKHEENITTDPEKQPHEAVNKRPSYTPSPLERKNSNWTSVTHEPVSNGVHRSISQDSNPQWMSTLKSQVESDVVNQTIEDPELSRTPSPAHSDVTLEGNGVNLVSNSTPKNSEFSQPAMSF